MTTEQRAKEIWFILVELAKNKKTFTYEDIGKLTGLAPTAVGTYLYPIQDYCDRKKIPQLACLVVHKSDGMPGSGLKMTQKQFSDEKEKIFFNFDWTTVSPTEKDFPKK